MRQSINPAIVALELELAEAKFKLAFYERHHHYLGERPLFDRDGLDLGTLSLQQRAPNITLPMRAEIEAALDVGADVRVCARTHEPEGKSIGLHYFVSSRDAFTTRDQAALLGHLQEQFVRELAEFIRQ